MNNQGELLSIWQGYDGSIKKNNPTYSGLLGLTIDGEQRVEHPTRNGFVYFRFRDNLSEVVLAFNDKVSPVYGLPVVVERVRNNWRVIGRDTDRYSNWGSSAPYLPKHGFQHSFNRDEGTGGDVVLVYPDQFMPLLVYPSGTFGAGNLIVAPYLLQRDSDFVYVGNTGTQNIIPYKPTNSDAIMGLVYLDRETGNPGFLINSGTPFSASITGTAGVSPYIPYPSSTQEPLYAFRLVSGTETLQWGNLYNTRQFVGGGQGGSSMITGGYMDLTTDQVAAGIKRFSDNIQVGIEPPALNTTGSISQASEGVGAGNIAWTWATGTASFMTGVLARGSKASPQAVQKDDILFRWRGRGHDGSTYGSTSVEIRGVADENHNSSGHGTRLEVWTTPTGTTTLTKALTIEQGGNINIEAGKTYNVNGIPYSTGGGSSDGWNSDSNTWTFLSSDAPSYVVSVNANVTGTVGVGMKSQLTHLGAVKNFIVTAVSVTGSTSYLNLYGGTDFTLNVTGTITNPKYSQAKAPFGFPISPAKWTETLTDTTKRTQSSPTISTWYSPGSLSISGPIGLWKVSYKWGIGTAKAASTEISVRASLSTANNSESTPSLTSGILFGDGSASHYVAFATSISNYVLSLASKTSYYPVIITDTASSTYIEFMNDTYGMVVAFECAYL